MPDCESKKYFPLSLESLRAMGGWAADGAERALAVYEAHAGSNLRPLPPCAPPRTNTRIEDLIRP